MHKQLKIRLPLVKKNRLLLVTSFMRWIPQTQLKFSIIFTNQFQEN